MHQRQSYCAFSSGECSMEAPHTSIVLWSCTNHHAATVEQAVSADCAVAELGDSHLSPREGGVREALRNLIRLGQLLPPCVPPALQEAPSAVSRSGDVRHG